jgi:hypothetical protein
MLDKDTIISLANEAGIKGPAPARQGFKMYASPQRLMKFAGLVTSKREWVGLTDEEISEIEDEYIVDYRIPAGSAWNFAKDLEAKLKEKNA